MRARDFIAEAKVKLQGFGGMDPKERAQRWIDRVYAEFPNQFDGNHVMVFGDGEDQQIAMFELVPNNLKPGAVEIKWISTFPQKSGVGRRAMTILQDLASEDNITLTLYPWSKGKVSQSTLQKIYKKMGFKQDTSSRNMTWEPSVNEAFTLQLTKKTPEVRMFTVMFNGNTVGQAMRFKDGTVKLQMGNHPVVTVKAASVLDAVNDWAAKIR